MAGRFIIRDPFALHREGVIKSRGFAMWRDNIRVARYVSESLKPCLGPSGMSKLVVDKFSETAVTSHGAVILDKMDMHHPVAKLLREAAKTVDKSVGDGTKTAIILIGELLGKAETLSAQKLEVNKIIRGYTLAYGIAMKHLKKCGKPIDNLESKTVKTLLTNLFTSRGLGEAEYLAEIAARAIFAALKDRGNKKAVDKDAIKIVKKVGGTLRDSRVVDGVIINKGVAHPAMPRIMDDVKIAVLNMALKIDEFRHLQPFKYHLEITNPNLIDQFLGEEVEIVKKVVDKIVSVGANMIICRKRIGDVAKQLLAEKGIMGVSRLLNEEEFNSVAKITGGRIVADVEDLREEDLGRASSAREEKIGDSTVIIVEGCNNAGGATILLRGVSESVLGEAEHTINDSIKYVSAFLENSTYLPGGGAIETYLASTIRNESIRYGGKEQEAMLAFADCLETIPKLIADNAGYDPIDVLTALRSRHAEGHHQYGIEPFSGKIVDMFKTNVVEPYSVKEQILKTSFETAMALLRIDELVDRRYAKRHEGELGGQ
ncbi:MAG: thermosome subunit alpha [Nitrososphaerota archaeon]